MPRSAPRLQGPLVAAGLVAKADFGSPVAEEKIVVVDPSELHCLEVAVDVDLD